MYLIASIRNASDVMWIMKGERVNSFLQVDSFFHSWFFRNNGWTFSNFVFWYCISRTIDIFTLQKYTLFFLEFKVPYDRISKWKTFGCNCSLNMMKSNDSSYHDFFANFSLFLMMVGFPYFMLVTSKREFWQYFIW